MKINKVKTKAFPKWPNYTEVEQNMLLEVLKSSEWCRLSGNLVKEFGQKYAKYNNVKYGIGVTNGTHALELALQSMRIKPGDEVILPAITFIATSTAVIRTGAIPIIVDVDPETYCIMPEAIEKAITKKTKAIIPVHLGGHACDMDKICDIARRNNLLVLEDAAHAQGGEYKGRRIGSIGDAAAYSFQSKKILSSGEGGAFITDNKSFYDEALLIQSVGRPEGDQKYEHLVLGTNYRMNSFQAALLIPQLETLDFDNQKREKNAKILDALLNEVKGIYPQKRKDYCTIDTHYMYMFEFDSDYFNGMSREEFVRILIEEGIPAHYCYPVVSDTEFFRKKAFRGYIDTEKVIFSGSLVNAERISSNVVWLPHEVLLGDEQDLFEIKTAIEMIQKSSKDILFWRQQ